MHELDKVIGYEPIKKELYRIIDVMQEPEKYRRLGVNTPKGILFNGVPGIGKSLIAKCFMAESGRTQFIIHKDIPDGAFIDFIRETFEKAAEQAPSIILLDDLDKFSNEDEYHRNTEEYVAVQAGIDKVKNKEVFVIATTNDYNSLPGSLARNGRFDKKFHMTFPKGEDAKKIVAYYLKDKKIADDIDVEEIVRFCRDYSCADLETVINEAGLYAGYEGHELITQEDIKKACLRKFYNAPAEESQVPEEILRRRAIHEAGHLLVAEHFKPGCVNFASISARDLWQGGVVSVLHDDCVGEIFRNMESDIMVSLAGKAATEVVLGETDLGTNRDLNEAYDNVRRLLDNNCTYDFSSWCPGPETAATIREHLDNACGVEMARYYKETRKILIEEQELLKALADALFKKKTLSYKDIALIKERYAA